MARILPGRAIVGRSQSMVVSGSFREVVLGIIRLRVVRETGVERRG